MYLTCLSGGTESASWLCAAFQNFLQAPEICLLIYEPTLLLFIYFFTGGGRGGKYNWYSWKGLNVTCGFEIRLSGRVWVFLVVNGEVGAPAGVWSRLAV